MQDCVHVQHRICTTFGHVLVTQNDHTRVSFHIMIIYVKVTFLILNQTTLGPILRNWNFSVCVWCRIFVACHISPHQRK